VKITQKDISVWRSVYEPGYYGWLKILNGGSERIVFAAVFCEWP
jgi:hypothetical protein